MPRIVEPTPQAIQEAAKRLRGGDVVAFPTETVYGLGADTFNPSAVGMIYAVKGRPANNPLIAHLMDESQARLVVAAWDERCSALAARFWPGPLTIVTTKHDSVPLRATAGLPTIAVRAPAHAVARELLEAFGGVISAPSANRSGRVSPTRAQHVAEEFSDVADLMIIDGGASEVGIESTVVDLSRRRSRMLRLGAVTVADIEAVVGEVDASAVTGQDASPGTALQHYSPRTPAELVDGDDLARILRESRDEAIAMLAISRCSAPGKQHHVIPMPDGADAYAARLYDALREADAVGAARILIERPSQAGGVWDAVHDRLRRATG